MLSKFFLATGIILTLFIVICYAQNVPSYVPLSGLKGWWPSNGNANDESVNGNNGTVNGATLTTDRFGNPNSAYNYTSSLTTNIVLPAATLNLNQYTYAAWVRLSTIPASGSRYFILSVGSTGGDQLMNYNNNYASGHGWCGGGYNIPLPITFYYNQITASANQWYHLVLTRSTTQSKFYINGVLANTTAIAATSLPSYGTSTIAAKIGTRWDNSVPFNGKIDDVGIWNRPLTATEITTLYNSIPTSVKPLNIENSIAIFPNPSNGIVTINIGDPILMNGCSIKIIKMESVKV